MRLRAERDRIEDVGSEGSIEPVVARQLGGNAGARRISRCRGAIPGQHDGLGLEALGAIGVRAGQKTGQRLGGLAAAVAIFQADLDARGDQLGHRPCRSRGLPAEQIARRFGCSRSVEGFGPQRRHVAVLPGPRGRACVSGNEAHPKPMQGR